jgi:DNA-binding response OmpR family regulator
VSALVLIADGNPEGLERLRRLTEREGVVAITASDSGGAMRLFVRREPQVTVLHVEPSHDLDLRLCRDMKNLKSARGRAIVIVGPRESRAAAFDAGCDAFVAWQADDLSLRRTVRRLLAVTRKSSTPDVIEMIA